MVWNSSKEKWNLSRWGRTQGVWVDRLDTSYWTPTGGGHGTWDGTKWNAENVGVPAETPHNVTIFPTGSWRNGYRPKNLRIAGNWNPADTFFQVNDLNDNLLYINDGDVQPNQTWEIDEWFGQDIKVVYLLSLNSFYLNKFQFFN